MRGAIAENGLDCINARFRVAVQGFSNGFIW